MGALGLEFGIFELSPLICWCGGFGVLSSLGFVAWGLSFQLGLNFGSSALGTDLLSFCFDAQSRTRAEGDDLGI